jgi:hypothetical protein
MGRVEQIRGDRMRGTVVEMTGSLAAARVSYHVLSYTGGERSFLVARWVVCGFSKYRKKGKTSVRVKKMAPWAGQECMVKLTIC